MAKGTKSRPIIMTSAQPFGQRNRGDWAGLVLLGKAPINVAANTGGNTNQAGTFYIEGLNTTPDGLYGGTDPNWNCGTLEYVRVEYAGFILSPNNEINSFTWGGCGKGTTVDHLQAIFGLDDTFEWFGGTMDAKYLVGGLGRDDYFDFQLGFTGRAQYVIGYQSPDFPGNRGIEGDNSEYDAAATPFSAPTLYNATFIGSGTPGLRRVRRAGHLPAPRSEGIVQQHRGDELQQRVHGNRRCRLHPGPGRCRQPDHERRPVLQQQPRHQGAEHAGRAD